MKPLTITAAVGLLALSSASFGGSPWTLPKDDFGGAVPLNMKHWVTYDDYPDVAAKSGQQGYVTVSFAIGVDGRMTDCNVIRSSGYSILDAIPCKVLPKRARFAPAKDANGIPITTRGSTSMSFWTHP
jgi:TonB family protein